MTLRVIFQGSYAAWEERNHPNEDRRIALSKWFADVVETGLPDDSLPVPFQLFVCRASAADVLVSFLTSLWSGLSKPLTMQRG